MVGWNVFEILFSWVEEWVIFVYDIIEINYDLFR